MSDLSNWEFEKPDGSKVSVDKLTDDYIKELFGKLSIKLPETEPQTMSFFEIALCFTISRAVKKAMEKGYDADGIAAYITGILSARLCLKEIDLVEKKKTENPVQSEYCAEPGYTMPDDSGNTVSCFFCGKEVPDNQASDASNYNNNKGGSICSSCLNLREDSINN